MLFITLGDPYSVNIAILYRLLAQPRSYPQIVIGSAWHWQEQTQAHPRLPFTPLPSLAITQLEQGLYFHDIGNDNCHQPAPTLSAQQRGTLAVAALQSLHAIIYQSRYAILTCPIDKSACAAAGFVWRGQTEFFASLYNRATIMILSAAQLRVGLVTNHLAVRELPSALTQALVFSKIKLFVHTLRTQLACPRPRVAVCGFNPHCGDGGLCGDEDIHITTPAVVAAQELPRCEVSGPHAADSVFHAARTGKYDGVLAMYHDQGLAPLKACAAYDAVNISGGLPILRIAPDHGPAADLYGLDCAVADSFVRCMTIIDSYLA